jgi:hypothetical protein
MSTLRTLKYVMSMPYRNPYDTRIVLLSMTAGCLIAAFTIMSLIMCLMLANELVHGTMQPEQAIGTACAIVVTIVGIIHWRKSRKL